MNEWNNLKREDAVGRLSKKDEKRLFELTKILSERSEELKSIVAAPLTIPELGSQSPDGHDSEEEEDRLIDDPYPSALRLSRRTRFTRRHMDRPLAQPLPAECNRRSWITPTAKVILKPLLYHLAPGSAYFVKALWR